MIQSLKDTYKRNERWVPIVFFVAGFVFDAIMLRRVDELLTILQQAAYIVVSALLIRFELIESQREIAIPNWFARIWKYREAVLHFLMGTLLNAYTIFYFKSASAFSSFAFIGLLVLLLMLNEFGRMGKSQTQVHMALLSLCLISYLATLSPILLGFLGLFPFVVANFVAILVFSLFYYSLKPSLHAQPRLLTTQLVLPFSGILGIFALLYFAHAIPPVPLSVQYMGIFHNVEKVDSGYELSFNRPGWYFWQHGDQTFAARPGDVIYCFVRVFSPARFKDRLQVRWLYHDPKSGWVTSDVISLQIVGGREEGYRGVTKKSKYQPGEWRVQVETADDREVGRIGFTVEDDGTVDDRILNKIVE